MISTATAEQVTDALVSVVVRERRRAPRYGTFEVAGKTGTARRTGAGGRYEAGSYTSSFAGFFPADAPQMVIFVKLDQPRGGYYGGLTAAPVSRETLQGMLAARSAGFDSRPLLATRAPIPRTPGLLALRESGGP